MLMLFGLVRVGGTTWLSTHRLLPAFCGPFRLLRAMRLFQCALHCSLHPSKVRRGVFVRTCPHGFNLNIFFFFCMLSAVLSATASDAEGASTSTITLSDLITVLIAQVEQEASRKATLPWLNVPPPESACCVHCWALGHV